MAELLPLMHPDMYEKLQALRHALLASGTGCPANVFVPVGAAPSEASEPRVLFVGKATRGWDETHFGSFEVSAKWSIKTAEGSFVNGCTAFFQFAREILRRVHKIREPVITDTELLHYYGWTNLAKIGDANKNPSPVFLVRQRDICIETLKSEIQLFKPTAVVVTATNYAQTEIIYPLFGHCGTWSFDTPCKTRIAYKLHQELGTTVIWTNHPQGMRPAGTRGAVQQEVADMRVKIIRGEPLPPSVIPQPL